MNTQYKYEGRVVRVLSEPGLDADKAKIEDVITGDTKVVYFHELEEVKIGGAVLS